MLLAEKEADNVIKEFLRNSEEERQSQAELLEREKQEEMQLLSSCHSEQSMLRMKDTLCKYIKILEIKIIYISIYRIYDQCVFTVAMEKLLEEEMCKARKLEEYTKYRDYTAQSLLTLSV